MKASLLHKLENLLERHQEISALLSDASIIQDQARFRDLSREYSQLQPIMNTFSTYQKTLQAIQTTEQMLKDSDPDMRELAEEELTAANTKKLTLEEELQLLLLPKDPDDKRNIYLEIRAGTGGDEAAIFAGDLFRMYSRYAEKQGWRIEIVSHNSAEKGGYKEIIAKISGTDVYSKLKFESGVHRVQRVPETEAQGRIHTSTCTVAVLPEVEEIDEIQLKPEDLRVDTYRASGAGGQHVNVTDSAIRITHIPTGVVVECQDERSQHKNRAKAMALIQSKILAEERRKQQEHQAATRKGLIGSGDRSERIRTYNYPQGRMTDHRINLTLYKLSDIIEGDLDPLIEPLIREYQADQLAELSGEEKNNS